jgi:hypothetical protein
MEVIVHESKKTTRVITGITISEDPVAGLKPKFSQMRVIHLNTMG